MEEQQELLRQAEQALRDKEGKRALELADRILEEDDAYAAAWLVAMKSFQLIYPVDQYNPENELSCGRFAIRSALKSEKYRVRKDVYLFYLTKIQEVLERAAAVLADGRQVLSFYQKAVYFDAAGAAARTMEQDAPVVRAVLNSFAYCIALFEAIPDSAIRRSALLNRRAEEIAVQWRRTYSYLEIRYEMYHTTLSREMVEKGLQQYARFLRAVKNREELLRAPVPFNLYRLDQTAY